MSQSEIRNPQSAIPRPAFTLVELMTVIVVIALLIGLLLPALPRAKEAANSMNCKSCLRQLFLAVHFYTVGNDGRYPAAWTVGTPTVAWCGGYHSDGGVTRMEVTEGPLWPYFAEKKVMTCRTWKPTQVKYSASGQISGYGINSQYVAGDWFYNPNDGQGGMSNYGRPARSDEIRNPMATILLADCARAKSGVMCEEIFVYPYYKGDGTSKNYATFHFRHDGRANAAFCDGHVEAVKPFKLDPGGDGLTGWIANDLMDRE